MSIQTIKSLPDAGIIGTGTSGLCHGKCYISAYKYKVMTKTKTDFTWFVERGCSKSTLRTPQKSGDVATASLFGVKVNYIIGFII